MRAKGAMRIGTGAGLPAPHQAAAGPGAGCTIVMPPRSLASRQQCGA